MKGLAGWFRGYGFDTGAMSGNPTEALRTELISLKGVGRETADVILVYALRRPAIIIDAYTRRLYRRLGAGFDDDDALREIIREDSCATAEECGRFHRLVLEHCIGRCGRVPACGGCPLSGMCAHASGAGSAGISQNGGRDASRTGKRRILLESAGTDR